MGFKAIYKHVNFLMFCIFEMFLTLKVKNVIKAGLHRLWFICIEIVVLLSCFVRWHLLLVHSVCVKCLHVTNAQRSWPFESGIIIRN